MSHHWFLSLSKKLLAIFSVGFKKSWGRWDTSLAICFTHHPNNATVQCLLPPLWRVRFPYWHHRWRIQVHPDAKSQWITTSRWIQGWLVFAMVWRRPMGVRPLPPAAVAFCSTTMSFHHRHHIINSNLLWQLHHHRLYFCHQSTMTDFSTLSIVAKTQLTLKADSLERYNQLTFFSFLNLNKRCVN